MALTLPQREALAAWTRNRVVVVKACPGAGKTTVFVEAMQQEIDTTADRRGVAAVSFTNVAEDEIRKRIGGRLVAPHFVGTLDTFLWRFVITPFAALAGLPVAGPTLVPAPIADVLDRPEFQYGGPSQRQSLYRCDLRSGVDGSLEVSIEDAPPIFRQSAAQAALRAKQAFWKYHGRLTHSDAQYVAAELLEGSHGKNVQALIARRFRALLVDECQDTRGFNANALHALAQLNELRLFVVGDSDQSIYGFGGGDKKILNRVSMLAGARNFALRETHRCSQRVAAVASALSRSGTLLQSVAGAPLGSATLVIHNHAANASEVATILTALRARADWPQDAQCTVLTRKKSTLHKLRGTTDNECPLSSVLARKTAKAAALLRNGESRSAVAVISHGLGDLLDVAPTRLSLSTAGISTTSWRKACYGILLEAARDRAQSETWGQWRGRVRAAYEHAISQLGSSQKVGSKFAKGRKEDEAHSFLAGGSISVEQDIHYELVHKVKGREFDSVLFYIPKPHARHAPCPSVEWWGTQIDSEELEVAFVAVSRARHRLALAVHSETAEALRRTQPDFFALFDVVELANETKRRARRARTRESPPGR